MRCLTLSHGKFSESVKQQIANIYQDAQRELEKLALQESAYIEVLIHAGRYEEAIKHGEAQLARLQDIDLAIRNKLINQITEANNLIYLGQLSKEVNTVQELLMRREYSEVVERCKRLLSREQPANFTYRLRELKKEAELHLFVINTLYRLEESFQSGQYEEVVESTAILLSRPLPQDLSSRVQNLHWQAKRSRHLQNLESRIRELDVLFFEKRYEIVCTKCAELLLSYLPQEAICRLQDLKRRAANELRCEQFSKVYKELNRLFSNEKYAELIQRSYELMNQAPSKEIATQVLELKNVAVNILRSQNYNFTHRIANIKEKVSNLECLLQDGYYEDVVRLANQLLDRRDIPSNKRGSISWQKERALAAVELAKTSRSRSFIPSW